MRKKTFKEKIYHYRGLLALAFILFHLGITFLYIGPQEIVPKKLRHYSSYYMLPFFNQQWGLFAPAPITEHEIYYSNPSIQEWINLVSEDHQKADKFLVTPHWRFSIGAYNLLYWVDRDLKFFKKSNGGLPSAIKEKYFKRYFSNKLIKRFTLSFLKRNKINTHNSDEHHIKCRWINLVEKDTTEVIFIYDEL